MYVHDVSELQTTMSAARLSPFANSTPVARPPSTTILRTSALKRTGTLRSVSSLHMPLMMEPVPPMAE